MAEVECISLGYGWYRISVDLNQRIIVIWVVSERRGAEGREDTSD